MLPLVLLPGMMCDARLFGPQIDAIGGTRKVIVGDITQQASISSIAEHVLDRAPERFALAGLSMGGIVAMEMLRLAGERVSKLALMDTNPLAEMPDVAARRGPQIERVRQGKLLEVMRDEMKPNYLTDGPGRDMVLSLCMDMALSLGPEVFVKQSHALRARPDQCDTLRSVKVPTLVLCGRHDALCPVKRHLLMHELIPGSDLTIIEQAGHLPTLEQPDHTTAALARWLEGANECPAS